MKLSRYFLKTTKTVSEDDTSVSARLLKQGGFIRESVAGRYYFLPIGQRVQQRIMAIVKEEMDAAGGQEMLAPILHPLELWQETNRTNTTGFELMKVKDRRGSEFALGGTAEEMFVDLIRQFTLSYRDLPLHLYQFSPKFRDELRARGGLLRVREFIMKDGYSFHADEEDFRREYEKMKKVYSRIFDRLGLQTAIVEADNGYIGGEYCHEFIVESEVGESRYFTTPDGLYAAHEDVAKFEKYRDGADEEMLPRKDVEGKGIIGVAELAKFLDIPVEKTTKTILFETEKGEVVAAAINGLYDINEVKLKNVIGCSELSLARPEVVERVTGAKVGYAGILNLSKEVRIVMDDSLQGRKNFECGANRTDYHFININFGRDIPEPEQFYDIALAKEGYSALGGGRLIEKKGIEVGNVFQLGLHYSSKMKGAVYTDVEGKGQPFYMGCYGIGIGRSMAAIVEKHHDAKGIIWPDSAAPFQVHLVTLDGGYDNAEKLYHDMIAAGVEVLYDDREKTAGEKFADADLIGIPLRVVVSKKTLEKESVELKRRGESEVKIIPLSDVINLVTEQKN